MLMTSVSGDERFGVERSDDRGYLAVIGERVRHGIRFRIRHVEGVPEAAKSLPLLLARHKCD